MPSLATLSKLDPEFEHVPIKKKFSGPMQAASNEEQVFLFRVPAAFDFKQLDGVKVDIGNSGGKLTTITQSSSASGKKRKATNSSSSFDVVLDKNDTASIDSFRPIVQEGEISRTDRKFDGCIIVRSAVEDVETNEILVDPEFVVDIPNSYAKVDMIPNLKIRFPPSGSLTKEIGSSSSGNTLASSSTPVTPSSSKKEKKEKKAKKEKK